MHVFDASSGSRINSLPCHALSCPESIEIVVEAESCVLEESESCRFEIIQVSPKSLALYRNFTLGTVRGNPGHRFRENIDLTSMKVPKSFGRASLKPIGQKIRLRMIIMYVYKTQY